VNWKISGIRHITRNTGLDSFAYSQTSVDSATIYHRQLPSARINSLLCISRCILWEILQKGKANKKSRKTYVEKTKTFAPARVPKVSGEQKVRKGTQLTDFPLFALTTSISADNPFNDAQ